MHIYKDCIYICVYILDDNGYTLCVLCIIVLRLRIMRFLHWL